MSANRKLQGVIPVVTTPMNKDGSIDGEALTRLVNRLIEKKVGGFWALGTGSEDMNLSYQKRLQVAQIVTEANHGRLPLILGAGFFALEEMLNFIDDTRELEFDAYHVMPYHPLLSLERLDWMYRHIADHAPKPLWMYTSQNWVRPVTPGWVEKLKTHPNIAGVKFSTQKSVDLIKVIGMADENFQVITAVAGQFFAVLAMGVAASTTSLASPLPDPLLNIYNLFQEGRHEEAMAAQRKLINFLDAMPKGVKADNFLAAAEEKYILSKLGICQEYVSGYYRMLTGDEKRQIDQALDDFDMMPAS